MPSRAKTDERVLKEGRYAIPRRPEYLAEKPGVDLVELLNAEPATRSAVPSTRTGGSKCAP